MIVNSNFVLIGGGKPILVGTTVETPPFIAVLSPAAAAQRVVNADGLATPLDRIVFDLALSQVPPALGTVFETFGKYVGGFAKNGCGLMTLVGTTPVNIDLTDLTLAASASIISAGDTSFTNVSALIFNNIGTADLIVTLGSSNPSRFPALSGTTPGFTVAAGGCVPWFSPVGGAVDSTHKILTVTPTSGGQLAFAVGGS
jgi:hypothetical protein